MSVLPKCSRCDKQAIVQYNRVWVCEDHLKIILSNIRKAVDTLKGAVEDRANLER